MNQLGYYGKTPHSEEFVLFNLPSSFIKVWDDWLRQVLIDGEDQNQNWASDYAKSPAYRFVLSSGIAGNTPWVGILKPSRDKVGRRFPFCLALSLPENELPCVSASTKTPWFEEAEALLARLMDTDYNFDDLPGELANIADKHIRPTGVVSNPITLGAKQSNDDVTISVFSSTALLSSQALPCLLDSVLQQTLGEYSLWMASGGTDVTSINSGLPIGVSGFALFNNEWKEASTAHIDLKSLQSNVPLEP